MQLPQYSVWAAQYSVPATRGGQNRVCPNQNDHTRDRQVPQINIQQSHWQCYSHPGWMRVALFCLSDRAVKWRQFKGCPGLYLEVPLLEAAFQGANWQCRKYTLHHNKHPMLLRIPSGCGRGSRAARGPRPAARGAIRGELSIFACFGVVQPARSDRGCQNRWTIACRAALLFGSTLNSSDSARYDQKCTKIAYVTRAGGAGAEKCCSLRSSCSK